MCSPARARRSQRRDSPTGSAEPDVVEPNSRGDGTITCIAILILALISFGLLLSVVALIGGQSWNPVLIVIGLVVALAGLTIGVHSHGWVTALDGPAATWINHRSQQFPRVRAAAAAVAHIGNPGAVALAGVVSGALLSAAYRSLIPGVTVVATIGATVFAKDIMKVVIERPVNAAEMAGLPGLGSAPHPFPSGHVAGTAALLGIVAVGIAARCSSALRAALVGCVVAGTMVVAGSRLVLQAHWLTDVVGGALLAGITVTVGATVLAGTARAAGRAGGRRVPAHREVAQRRSLRT